MSVHQSTPELREIARQVADITSRMTVPEINEMLAQLDLSRVEHQMIRVCLLAETQRREARFASLYATPVKPERPSVVARLRGWVSGLFGGMRAMAVAR